MGASFRRLGAPPSTRRAASRRSPRPFGVAEAALGLGPEAERDREHVAVLGRAVRLGRRLESARARGERARLAAEELAAAVEEDAQRDPIADHPKRRSRPRRRWRGARRGRRRGARRRRRWRPSRAGSSGRGAPRRGCRLPAPWRARSRPPASASSHAPIVVSAKPTFIVSIASRSWRPAALAARAAAGAPRARRRARPASGARPRASATRRPRPR